MKHYKPFFNLKKYRIIMESLIVHPKNQMELNALKTVLKDMGIRYEKFHTLNRFSSKSPSRNPAVSAKTIKNKPKDGRS